MKYPLQEKIGKPELLVGREKEFEELKKWIANISKKLSGSRVILARRKSGKTAIVQRVFNRLWRENGDVIPFYFEIAENKIWYPMFAMDYYRAFASQYISFLERDERLLRSPLSLEKIREYGLTKSLDVLAEDADSILHDKKEGFHDLMWKTAYSAPNRVADVYDQRVLVILDEFQNIAQYVYRNEECKGEPDESMPGSFHSLSESKIAPMLVTGSYISWLLNIAGKYLQAGRLDEWRINPYLIPEKGLEAVYGYARIYDEPITNETAFLINQLCMSDPFFISCVMQSRQPDRNLATEKGVIETFNYEITDRRSRMSKTWNEYIQLTLKKVNDRYAKGMLLHLSKHSDRYWTHQDIKDELQMDLDLDEIREKLILLVEADVIEWGSSDIRFRGLRDGTLSLVLRNRFEEEINGFAPDLRQEAHKQIRELKREKKRLQGMLNNLSGKFAEYQLATAFRSKKWFALSDYFAGAGDMARLNITCVRQRVPLQRENGKNMELDVVAESECGRVIVVEVKKQKTRVGRSAVEDFAEKVEVYARSVSGKKILPAFLSLGGFAGDAMRLCEKHGIRTAERIAHF
ncbi:hypothetical protein QUF80_18075 [Desulfococcaceae bacterium HSG8]|nr:hypothetical protein [Desulfococcaceae bacterium HSG8]